ncbi:MAG TPA: hypothetical protein VF145_04260 [Chitinophagaceae bacterium]
MDINLRKLEENVNLHTLQPGFLNRELYYVIALDPQHFRFVEPEEEAGEGEMKLFCYLSDREILIPAGNIILKKSYVVTPAPPFEIIRKAEDFYRFIDCIGENCVGKAIRGFSEEALGGIAAALKQRYGNADQHIVTSPEFSHLLFILPEAEISISSTMVYFKQRLPVTTAHYQHLEEEKVGAI